MVFNRFAVMPNPSKRPASSQQPLAGERISNSGRNVVVLNSSIMSKSAHIEFRGEWFWSFDVVLAVLLKHLIDAAAPHVPEAGVWLAEAVEHWRVGAIMPDVSGNPIDDAWSNDQIAVVVELIEDACAALLQHESIPATEIAGWDILDGEAIFTRGYPSIPTKPIIRLGNAIIALLTNELPPAPPGTRWWYGIEDEPATIPSR